MPAKQRGLSLDHPIAIAFLILAIIAFTYFASEVLKPLALAVLLSFALAPVAGFIERQGLRRFPSVVLTVLLALTGLGAFGYKVGDELNSLALSLDKDRLERNLYGKFRFLKPGHGSAIGKLSSLGQDLSKTLDRPPQHQGALPVQIVSEPTYTERLQAAVGPYLESVGVALFVLVLVLFILATREDLKDRIIRLCGQSRVSLTTKTMDEVGQRISRYLLMFALVNSAMGLAIGLGLWAIGVPLAILWGVLTALLRFTPYVGPTVAFAMPFVYSIAMFPGWKEPLLVIGLFALVETLANSYFEPVIYGKTTGVNALGLLVAAMFWTWLWGGLGLLLSTPLTVCLAVMGKSVRGLEFFAILLGEEDPLEPDLRFYQRLLAVDQDGAEEIVQAELKQHPRAEVFDTILAPTLSRAERDRDRGDIDDRESAFVQRFVGELLDDLAATPEVSLTTLAPGADAAAPATSPSEPARRPLLLGITANDHADAIVLRMLDLLLEPSGFHLTVLEEQPITPLKLSERVEESDPDLVILSHLPPSGSARARYLVRRLRARFPELSLLVGRWAETGAASSAAERLTAVGATCVVFRLADARDEILKRLAPRPEPDLDGAPLEPAAGQPA